MALTLLTSPGAYALAKNTMLFNLRTNARYGFTKYRGVIFLNISDYPSDGETFTIGWGGNSITYTFKTTPDSSGLQLPISGGSGFSDYVENYLIPAIKAHYETNLAFTLDYSISGGFQTVEFVTREAGKWSANTSYSGANFYTYVLNSGSDGNPKANFKILMEVWNQTTDTLITTLEQFPDTSDDATFDISEHLRAQFTVLAPDPFAAWPQKTGSLLKYKVRYAESFGDTPMVQKMAENSGLLAINGGVAKEDLGSSTFLSDIASAPRPFFTNAPLIKKVGISDLQTLSFIPLISVTALQAKAYWSDGTSTSFYYSLQSIPTDNFIWQKGILPSGIEAIGGGKTLTKFDIWVYNPGEDVEVRTFVIDRNSYKGREKYFYFRNSLGGYDTMRTTGKWAMDDEVNSETYSTILPTSYTSASAEIKKRAISGSKTVGINSGFMPLAWRDFFAKELLRSEEVYELIDGKMYSIIVTSKSAELHGSDNDVTSFSFEYQYAFDNTQYGSL